MFVEMINYLIGLVPFAVIVLLYAYVATTIIYWAIHTVPNREGSLIYLLQQQYVCVKNWFLMAKIWK